MSIIVLSFGLNGIGIKRGCLRGMHEEYPLTTFRFLFFRAVILGKAAAGLHMDAMFGLARGPEWAMENYPSIKKYLDEEKARTREEERAHVAHRVAYLEESANSSRELASKAQAENYALRKCITICSEPDQPTKPEI